MKFGIADGIAVACVTIVCGLVASAQPSGPDGQIPIPVVELENRLMAGGFDIVTVEGAGGGVTGAKKLGLKYPSDGLAVSVKWKPVPSKGDGWNNSPRRELAAYTIQKWFLDPIDYVVPTTVTVCVPFQGYAPVEPDPKPNIGDFQCVVGVVSVWLDNVTVPDELYDPKRFESDPNYAHHMADMNLLAYLVDHKDGRGGNFLTSIDATNRRVFAVDNGISFGVFVQNWFVKNWHKIRVPGLRKLTVDRLRRVSRNDLDALGTVSELRKDEHGAVRNHPSSQNLDPDKGSRIASDRLQLGLTRSEIDEVQERIEDLLNEIDDGDISTF